MNEAGNICTTLPLIGDCTNGAGFAPDADVRGLKAQLRDEIDFGRHTSSASARLIHGGLRYLEKFDFKLVGHSLRERGIVLRNSPRIIWQRTRQGICMNAHQSRQASVPYRFILYSKTGMRDDCCNWSFYSQSSR